MSKRGHILSLKHTRTYGKAAAAGIGSNKKERRELSPTQVGAEGEEGLLKYLSPPLVYLLLARDGS